ncbi:MAG: ribosome small subunit-dependent GTPase A [Chloroflexota bacterium]
MTPEPAATSELTLAELGWTLDRAEAFEPRAAEGLMPGRVVSSSGVTMAATAEGLRQVVVQRAFMRSVVARTELPTIGDWLSLAPQASSSRLALLRSVLTRHSTFTRQRLFDGQPQVLAANVDIAFLVSGLDQDLNLRRIERYLVLAHDGGVLPVLVLNKADVATDLAAAMAAVETVAGGVQVVVVSAATGDGLDAISAIIEPGMTACLLGSSGVGKSTITNALLGEQRQAVKALREDDSRGRHTTTHRELFALAGGGLLIDTPGLRSVGVLGDGEALERSFDDVESLARSCRFADCQHGSEPGCAVQAAIEAGTLSPSRLASYRELEVERRSVELRAAARAQREAQRGRSRCYRRTSRDATRLKRGD